MTDPKRPSLTILGGPMAGKRFLLESESAGVVVGSDDACSFQIGLPGVSPMHARITFDASGVVIHEAGSPRGLHVNDNKVVGSAPLRNGDIVWLGTPGEADVVMLQCVLPPGTRAASAPHPAPPEPPLDDLSLEAEASPEPALTLDEPPSGLDEPPSLEEPPGLEEPPSLEEPPTLEEPPGVEQPLIPEPPPTELLEVPSEAPHAAAPGTAPAGEMEFVLADETTAQEQPRFPPYEPPPSHFEDETEDTVLVEAPRSVEPTVAMPPAEQDATMLVSETPVEPTVAMPPAPEPTIAMPPPARPSVPARPREPAPAHAAAPPSHAPRPAGAPAEPRPARPATIPPTAGRRPPAPRPPAREGAAGPRRSSSAGLFAVLGLGALVVLGAGGWAAWRFVLSKRVGTPVAQVPPATAPAVVTLPRQTLPPPITAPVEVVPAPAPIESAPAVTPTPPPPLAPAPTPRPAPTPAPKPTPTPSPRKAAPTPAPVATPAGPSPETVRAQQTAAQVAALVSQAENAVAARQYDAAIGSLDQALKLDPGNAKAAADRSSAVALRDAARKRFVAGRTIVKTEKAQDGLAGFEGAAVQKAPDFSGRIEFEMTPASGIRPGDNYSLKYYLVNEGKKSIKVGGVSATTTVNGQASGGAGTPQVREVNPQQRALLGETTGSWVAGTTSWSTEVLVTANKGDSLQSTITWR